MLNQPTSFHMKFPVVLPELDLVPHWDCRLVFSVDFEVRDRILIPVLSPRIHGRDTASEIMPILASCCFAAVPHVVVLSIQVPDCVDDQFPLRQRTVPAQHFHFVKEPLEGSWVSIELWRSSIMSRWHVTYTALVREDRLWEV